MILSRTELDATKQKSLSFQQVGQLKRKIVVKIEYIYKYILFKGQNHTCTKRKLRQFPIQENDPDRWGEYSCRCHGERVISAPSKLLKLKLAGHIL